MKPGSIDLDGLAKVLARLPRANYEFLRYFTFFLSRVADVELAIDVRSEIASRCCGVCNSINRVCMLGPGGVHCVAVCSFHTSRPRRTLHSGCVRGACGTVTATLCPSQSSPARQLACQRIVEAILKHPTGIFTVAKPDADPEELKEYLREVLGPDVVGRDGSDADGCSVATDDVGSGGGADGAAVTVEGDNDGVGSVVAESVGRAGSAGGECPVVGASEPGGSSDMANDSGSDSPIQAAPSAPIQATAVATRDVGTMWPEAGQPSVGGARDHAHNKAELHEEPEHIVQAIIDIRHAWAAAGHPVPPAVEKALMHIIVCANREAAKAEELLVDKVRDEARCLFGVGA